MIAHYSKMQWCAPHVTLRVDIRTGIHQSFNGMSIPPECNDV